MYFKHIEMKARAPINARYVFPASTRAAVYAMRMRIGDQLIVAKIKEREKAKQEFDKAKEEGKSASLLEQNRPNVFSMSLANVMPAIRLRSSFAIPNCWCRPMASMKWFFLPWLGLAILPSPSPRRHRQISGLRARIFIRAKTDQRASHFGQDFGGRSYPGLELSFALDCSAVAESEHRSVRHGRCGSVSGKS